MGKCTDLKTRQWIIIVFKSRLWCFSLFGLKRHGVTYKISKQQSSVSWKDNYKDIFSSQRQS